MKLSREVKTAILVIGCIVMFIFGFNYLKGASVFDRNIELHTYYNEVEGLMLGAKVTINGLSIGKVTAIDLNEDYSKIKVSFSVSDAMNFSKESVAQLYEAGLIGGKAIAILPVIDPAQPVQDGDFLLGEIKPGLTELINQQVAPLQNKIEVLLTSADSLFAGVSNVLNHQTQTNLKESLAGFTLTIQKINDLTTTLDRMLRVNEKAMETSLSNIATTSVNLERLSDSLSRIKLAETVNAFKNTATQLSAVLAKVDQGEGSLGKLLQEDTLYDNLNQSSAALEALLSDLKEHPKRYVHFSIFGRKEKPSNNTY